MPKALIHIGEGDSRETYEYDRKRILNVEFGAVERATGLIGSELDDALNKGGQGAISALIWVLRKRTSPRARLEDVVFPVGTLVIELVNDDGTPLEDDEDDESGEAKPETEAPKDKKASKS